MATKELGKSSQQLQLQQQQQGKHQKCYYSHHYDDDDGKRVTVEQSRGPTKSKIEYATISITSTPGDVSSRRSSKAIKGAWGGRLLLRLLLPLLFVIFSDVCARNHCWCCCGCRCLLFAICHTTRTLIATRANTQTYCTYYDERAGEWAMKGDRDNKRLIDR